MESERIDTLVLPIEPKAAQAELDAAKAKLADATAKLESAKAKLDRLTAETTDLYADWNGLQTRLPDTGGILRRGLAGLLLAGGGLALWTVGRRRRTE